MKNLTLKLMVSMVTLGIVSIVALSLDSAYVMWGLTLIPWLWICIEFSNAPEIENESEKKDEQ